MGNTSPRWKAGCWVYWELDQCQMGVMIVMIALIANWWRGTCYVRICISFMQIEMYDERSMGASRRLIQRSSLGLFQGMYLMIGARGMGVR